MAFPQAHVPWQNGKSTNQALAYLWMKPTLSDVTFVFPDEKDTKPIPAHKMVLSMRSAEFEKLFYGSNVSSPTVEIHDILRETFQNLLCFLYTDKAPIHGKSVISLLYAAQKYEVTTLVKDCQVFLEEAMDIENVSLILGQASLFGMLPLQRKAITCIEESTEVFVKSKHFLSLSREDLSLILQSDNLNASEVTIFHAVIRWAAEQCRSKKVKVTYEGLKTVLGAVLYDIRFPTMTIEEFSEHVADSGILTEEEQLEVFKYLSSKIERKMSKFNTKKRRGSDVVIDFTRLKTRDTCEKQPQYDPYRFSYGDFVLLETISIRINYTRKLVTVVMDNSVLMNLPAMDPERIARIIISFLDDRRVVNMNISTVNTIEIQPPFVLKRGTNVIEISNSDQEDCWGSNKMRGSQCQQHPSASFVEGDIEVKYTGP